MIDVVAPSHSWFTGQGYWLCYHVKWAILSLIFSSRMFRRDVMDVKSCHHSWSSYVSMIVVVDVNVEHCHCRCWLGRTLL